MYNYVEGVQLPRNGGVNGQFGYTVSGLRRLKPEMKKNLFCIPNDSIMTCLLVKIHLLFKPLFFNSP